MMTLGHPSTPIYFYFYQGNTAILMPKTLRIVTHQEGILKENEVTAPYKLSGFPTRY
jgi:hypothetical protein